MNPNAPTPAAPAASDNQAIIAAIGGLSPAPAPTPIGGAQPMLPPAPSQYEPEINFDPTPGDNEIINTPVPPMPGQPFQQSVPPAPVAQPPVYAPQPQAPVASPVPPAPQIDLNAIPLAPTMTPQAPAPSLMYSAEQVQAIIASMTPQPQAPVPPTPAAPAQPWTPEAWADVDARIRAEAESIVNQRLTAEQQRQQDATAAAEAGRREADTYIDNQVAELEKNGYLPPVTNQADQSDPGRLARQELYAYALSLGTDNLGAVAPNLYALHQSGYFYDRGQNKLIRRGSQSQAAAAPISGGAPVDTTPTTPTGPTMKDFQTKSLDQLAEDAARMYPTS